MCMLIISMSAFLLSDCVELFMIVPKQTSKQTRCSFLFLSTHFTHIITFILLYFLQLLTIIDMTMLEIHL